MVRDLVGTARARRQLLEPVPLGLCLHRGQLFRGHSVRGQLLDLLEQRVLDLLQVDTVRRDAGQRPERHPADQRKRPAGHRLRDLLVADQPPVQAAALPRGEDVEREPGRVQLGRAVDRQPEHHRDQVGRYVGHDVVTLYAGHRADRPVGCRRRRGDRGQVAEVPLGGVERVLLGHVADDRQDRVVRPVVLAEERVHVLQRGGVQVLHRPDRHVCVRVAFGEREPDEPLVRVAVRAVVVALPLLFLDHVTLVVQVLLVDRVEQVAHPVRLEPEREVETAAGQRLEVVRAVEEGARVQAGAGGLQQAEVLTGGDVARPLEHQVLEEVREPGQPRWFVARPDVVPEVDGDDRDGAVRAHDDPEAVVERLLRDGVRQGHTGHHTWSGNFLAGVVDSGPGRASERWML
jgi:hypothetical protein